MVEMDRNAALLKEMQVRLDRKVKDGEIETIEYWKEQIDRIVAMKPEGVAALQQQLKKISDMMNTRVRTIKKELSN
jgi:hypothetical protein